MEASRRRLFLIDSMNYIFRAYHQPQTQRFYTGAGLPTGAVFVLHNMLRKLLAAHQPDYVTGVFDVAAPTFRDALFADYKANRAEMPSELAQQIPYIRRLLEALHIPILEFAGYEADDLIGALAVQGAQAGLEVTIVSSDKDMLQLVTSNGGESPGLVRVLIPTKDDLVCDAAKVEELLGVPPWRVPDVMALRGDAIDNIPGAPGIGEKGSRELIQHFGSVEEALQRAKEVGRKTCRESLEKYRDQILLSKKLATIETAVPVSLELEAIATRPPDKVALQQLYKELEFHSLAQELLPALEVRERDHSELSSEAEVAEFLQKLPAGTALPVALPMALEVALQVVLEAGEEGQIRFGPGLAVSPQAGLARVIPERLLPAARTWLESDERFKAVCNAKAAIHALRARGMALRGVRDDTLLYSYLLDPTQGNHTLEEVAKRRFGARLSGSPAERSDVLGQLARLLAPEVEQAGLRPVYEEIELPLTPVLAEMEEVGVRVDTRQLAELSEQLAQQIETLTAEIHKLSGAEFNINSPQQLAKVLFEQLKLPAPRKYGKGKVYSTAVDVLEELAEAHEVPRKVLEFRQLTKLKNTYIDALPKLVNPRTGRIHTTFDQAGTATGRLSSRDPTCRTFPSAPNWDGGFARHSCPRMAWPSRGGRFSRPTTRRSSCACWPTSPRTRCCWKPSARIRTSIREPPSWCSACRLCCRPASTAVAPRLSISASFTASAHLASHSSLESSSRRRNSSLTITSPPTPAFAAILTNAWKRCVARALCGRCTGGCDRSRKSTAAMPNSVALPSGPPSTLRCKAPPLT